MSNTIIRFTSFPLTEPPPAFVPELVSVFQKYQNEIATSVLPKGLKSDEVLSVLRSDLIGLGFEVEGGKKKHEKIQRPVFYGENGIPAVRYQIDAYNPSWRCALEVEAGRAWMGNAVYRDLIQAAVMVNVDYLVLAVPLTYRYQSNGRSSKSTDYDNTKSLAGALFGHSRLRLPYNLVVIGY